MQPILVGSFERCHAFHDNPNVFNKIIMIPVWVKCMGSRVHHMQLLTADPVIMWTGAFGLV